MRMIRVDAEYRGEAFDCTISTICLRLSANFGRGTCCGDGLMHASFAPNQIVRSCTFGALPLFVAKL